MHTIRLQFSRLRLTVDADIIAQVKPVLDGNIVDQPTALRLLKAKWNKDHPHLLLDPDSRSWENTFTQEPTDHDNAQDQDLPLLP